MLLFFDVAINKNRLTKILFKRMRERLYHLHDAGIRKYDVHACGVSGFSWIYQNHRYMKEAQCRYIYHKIS